jgi:hypothetical protein
MRNTYCKLTVLLAVCCTAVQLEACASRSAASASPEHIRGTVQSLDGQVLTVATSTGAVPVLLEQPTKVATVVQSDREHITDGSFLGVTSVTQPDGSERAVEVHVFPEAMRGSGEGSYGWDLPGTGRGSKMTNGTAAASRMTNGTVSSSKMTNGTVTAQEDGSSLTLVYKDGTAGGSRTIIIPPGIPIVAIEQGQAADVRPGAHVFVVAHRSPDGTLIADRVLAGKDGVVPPM